MFPKIQQFIVYYNYVAGLGDHELSKPLWPEEYRVKLDKRTNE